MANHHIAPGKKQWTWGNHDFGYAWDRNLTDSDGPYIELMAGVYTDNQPDFSFLAPGETKTFSQYWYPIRAIGVPQTANQDGAVHLEVADGIAHIGICVTRDIASAMVTLKAAQKVIQEVEFALSVTEPLAAAVGCAGGNSACRPFAYGEGDWGDNARLRTGGDLSRSGAGCCAGADGAVRDREQRRTLPCRTASRTVPPRDACSRRLLARGAAS